MENLGVVVAHDQRRIVEQVAESLEAIADLFVAGTSPDAVRPGQVLVAGGEVLVALERSAHPLVALAGTDALRCARAALAAAPHDIVRWPEEAVRLPGAIRRAGSSTTTARAGRGRVVALASARGGAGSSTVLAALASRAVGALVLDLDVTGAGQRAFGTAEPDRTLQDIEHLLADLAAGALEPALVPHTGTARALHTRALCAPPSVTAVHGLLRAARELASVTYVDCGRVADAAARAAMLGADVRCIVLGNDVASVRGARAG